MTESSLISLRGLELIIAYRGADQERRDNLRGVLRHLHRTYSDYQIWLIEADAAPTFAWSELADPKIRHLFVHDTGPFSKASLVNLGVLMTKSPDYLHARRGYDRESALHEILGGCTHGQRRERRAMPFHARAECFWQSARLVHSIG